MININEILIIIFFGKKFYIQKEVADLEVLIENS